MALALRSSDRMERRQSTAHRSYRAAKRQRSGVSHDVVAPAAATATTLPGLVGASISPVTPAAPATDAGAAAPAAPPDGK